MSEVRLKGFKKKLPPVYRRFMDGNENYIQIYFGGSSSGKSYNKAMLVALDCLKGINTLVIRKTCATIGKSVYNEVKEKISDMKLMHLFRFKDSTYEITCRKNSKQIIFVGADDTEKLKSIKPKMGVFESIWLEEATEFSYRDYKTILKRLRGKSKFTKKITLTFNPVMKTHWIFKEFFGIWKDNGGRYFEKDGVSILKTTYKDNPHLAPEDIKALEDEKDPYYRDVYTLGNWGVLGKMIFSNYEFRDFNYDEFPYHKGGIDWGFSTDPFAFNKTYFDEARKTLYVWGELHLVETPDDDIWEMKKDNGEYYIPKDLYIVADCAEPKTIKRWRNEGYDIEGCKKGAGSIETGIKFLQRLKIVIHTDSPRTKEEFDTYQWIVDKDGNQTKRPVDKNNHHIDEIRYQMEEFSFENNPTIHN